MAQIKITLLGKEYTTNCRSLLSLAPIKRFIESGGETVDGWEGASYCLGELLQFNPPLPEELVWYRHLIIKGEEAKKYGMNLTEHELTYILSTIAEGISGETLPLGIPTSGQGFGSNSKVDKNDNTNNKIKTELSEKEQAEIKSKIEELQQQLQAINLK